MAQLRDFLQTLPAPGVFECNLSPFEEYCIERGPFSHTLSKMYALVAAPREDFQSPFFQRWELELNKTFTEEQHTNIIHFKINLPIYNEGK